MVDRRFIATTETAVNTFSSFYQSTTRGVIDPLIASIRSGYHKAAVAGGRLGQKAATKLVKNRRRMRSTRSHLFLGYWSGLNSALGTTKGVSVDDKILKPLAPYIFILGGNFQMAPIYWMVGRAKARLLG
jgi:hypothetical protein